MTARTRRAALTRHAAWSRPGSHAGHGAHAARAGHAGHAAWAAGAVHAAHGAHPARFRRPRLLIVGCGDIGLRVARLLASRWHLIGLTSSSDRCAVLRAAGVQPLLGDLDVPASLTRLSGLADAVLHLAPPPGQGSGDPRTAQLLAALWRSRSPSSSSSSSSASASASAPSRSRRLRCIVYASTSGVYGDCGGAFVDETRAVNPATPRAQRRVDAERRLRRHGRAGGLRISLLRIPGIYASDRPGGHPRDRLARGAPVLVAEDDVFTNHIHADDLARICVAALYRGLPQRVVHASDDTALKMGDYFDLAADLEGVPRPRRTSRQQASRELSPMQLSFMGESRRLVNERLKSELRLRLRYPTVKAGLVA